MSEFLQKIINPQLKFEGFDESEKFSRFFADLYRIEILKDGLDLILTKTQEKDLHFEVKIIKDWDTNLGCYLTEQNKVYNKVLGKFSREVKKTIILKKFSHNVMAHEMAHALEVESGIDLGEEFNKCLSIDLNISSIIAELNAKYGDGQQEGFAAKHAELNIRQASLKTLNVEIRRLMFDALKAYPPHQFLAELFARYIELLSLTRDVHGVGDFTSVEVMDFFVNTTNFITKIFNPRIKNKINPKIALATQEIVAQVRLAKPEKKFQDNVNSFYKMQGEGGKKSWTKNVKSNAAYQVGWQQYQGIEDKKGE